MTYGTFSYGSATIGGSIGVGICGAPNANLVVMDQLLKIGYTYEEISKLSNLIE